MNWGIRLAVATLAALAVAAIATGVALPVSAAGSVPSSASTDIGEAGYADHCAVCHGDNLQGQENWRRRLPNGRLPAPPLDGSGHAAHHPDAMLLAIVRDGAASIAGYESDMPGFKNVLGDDDIRAILAFIKTSWPKPLRIRQERMSRRKP